MGGVCVCIQNPIISYSFTYFVTGSGNIPNKTRNSFLRQLKMELPFDLAIPLLGLYPKSPETPIQKNLCTPMFIAAQFIIAKPWKQPKCPSANEWIKKLWYIYTMEFTQQRERRSLYLLQWHGWNWRALC